MESVHEQYDDEACAHRTAYASLTHSFEKIGEHWNPRTEKGPSDPQAKGGRDAVPDDEFDPAPANRATRAAQLPTGDFAVEVIGERTRLPPG